MTSNVFRVKLVLEFVVPNDRFSNETYIEKRVGQVPSQFRGSFRTVLRYLYLQNGPTNLPKDRLTLSIPYLDSSETIVVRWLRTRTNGSQRKNYGAPALKVARNAKYKCEECGFPDVRTLHLDHIQGRLSGSQFRCLCANCHNIKSRKEDWTGVKRTRRRGGSQSSHRELI